MSLSGFVSNYIFLPLVRRTGKVEICLLITFVLMGLWHDMGWTYLIWGIFHGTAMATHYRYKRFIGQFKNIDKLKKYKIYSMCSRIATLSFISYVSAIGQSNDIYQAIKISRALFGF